MLVGCVPSHAAYFSAYEVGKVQLGVNAPGHHPVAAALTGACATLLHDTFSAPVDLVKQRLQLGYYKGIAHCVRSIVAEEGALSLWRSFPATLAMNVPYAAAAVAANESAKVLLKPLLGADSFFTYLLSGACAGAAAAAVTTPLDVVKTRIQTNGLLGSALVPVAPLCDTCVVNNACVGTHYASPCAKGSSSEPAGSGSASSASSSSSASAKSSSGGGSSGAVRNSSTLASAAAEPVASAAPRGAAASAAGAGAARAAPALRWTTLRVAQDLFREEGVNGLFRGLRARVAVNAPSQAISWATYELVKGLLFRVASGGGGQRQGGGE